MAKKQRPGVQSEQARFAEREASRRTEDDRRRKECEDLLRARREATRALRAIGKFEFTSRSDGVTLADWSEWDDELQSFIQLWPQALAQLGSLARLLDQEPVALLEAHYSERFNPPIRDFCRVVFQAFRSALADVSRGVAFAPEQQFDVLKPLCLDLHGGKANNYEVWLPRVFLTVAVEIESPRRKKSQARELPVLTEQQQAFRDIFLERAPHDAITGPRACELYTSATGIGIEESDFRSRVRPALAPWGLQNERKKGYFFPEHAPARRKARG